MGAPTRLVTWLFTILWAWAHLAHGTPTALPTPTPSVLPTPTPSALSIPTSSPTAARLPLAPTQRNALKRLYEATEGPSWTYSPFPKATRWNFSNPKNDPCLAAWAGVTCGTSAESPSLSSVTALDLKSFGAAGCLPPEIGKLTDLTSLDLSSNRLSGQIPWNVSSLTSLHTMHLGANSFTGSLPSLKALTKLQFFSVAYSSLKGTFPSFLLTLHGMQYVDLFRNRFSGRIPESIGGMSGLSYLGLDKNQFTGTIPSVLGMLTKLTKLAVNNNKLGPGTLPSSLGNLGALTYLAVHFSALTGTIPQVLGSMTSLKGLRANDNSLVGTIPPSLTAIPTLTQLDLFNNTGLTGPLPSTLFGLSALTKLDVSNCSLSGTLGSVNSWRSLVYLSLHSNAFSGELPAMDSVSASHCSKLNVYYAQNNRFSGSIPREIGLVCPALTTLILSENLLTSSVPSSIGDLTALITLKLDANRLTNGDTFADASFVRNLKSLQFLGLTANFFTGPISGNFFSSPKMLRTIALSANCFRGELPSAICQAQQLQYIVMDGLATGVNCRRLFLPFVKDSIVNGRASTQTIDGALPACVFSLPGLQKLHMSGNGMHGSLPSLPYLPRNLSDITLANNQLFGSIPPVFQALTAFSNLDLSYNMISGGLLPSLGAAPSLVLSLKINRLSGLIPPGILRAASVNILEGNLFDCATRDGLPADDPYFSNFQCGSIAFDKFIYAFISIGVAACVLIKLLGMEKILSITGDVESIFTFKKLENTSNPIIRHMLRALHNVRVITHILLYTRKLAFIIAGGAVAVLVPIYGVLSVSNGTYAREYSWTISAVFKGGTAPAVTLLVCWSGVIVGTNILVLHYFRDDIETIKNNPNNNPNPNPNPNPAHDIETINKQRGCATAAAKTNPASAAETNPDLVAGNGNGTDQTDQAAPSDASKASAQAERARMLALRGSITMQALLHIRILLIVCINCLVTLLVNIYYVYLVNHNTATVQVFSKIALSLFKLMWNLQVVRFMCSAYTVDYIGVIMGISHEDMREVHKTFSVLKVASIFELLLIIFNNIIAPVCATAFVDPQCFYHVFQALPAVVTSYFVMDCVSAPKYGLGGVIDPNSVNTNCYMRATESSYDPTFSYKNQCSSVLIQFYAPVLVLVTLWPTFGRPLKDYLIRLHLNMGFWGAVAGLGVGEPVAIIEYEGKEPFRESESARESRESVAEQQQRWTKHKAYYYTCLKFLSSKLLWSDPELAMRKEIDEHTIEYLSLLFTRITPTLSPPLAQSPAPTAIDAAANPEATGGEVPIANALVIAAPTLASPLPTKAQRHHKSKFFDVQQYFLETLSDLTSLLTFGVICPILGVALGASIASRTLQWQHALVKFLIRRKETFRDSAFMMRGTLPATEKLKLSAVLCEELDLDCSKIAFGANPTRANWVITLFSIVFLGFFLLDMAASSSARLPESTSIVQALWAPLLLLALPLISLIFFQEKLLAVIGSHRQTTRQQARAKALAQSRAKEEADDDSEDDEFNQHNVVPTHGEEQRSADSILASMYMKASNLRNSIERRLSGDFRVRRLNWMGDAGPGGVDGAGTGSGHEGGAVEPVEASPPADRMSAEPRQTHDSDFDIHIIHDACDDKEDIIELGPVNPLHVLRRGTVHLLAPFKETEAGAIE